jgi:branched-chain amino acid transport system substrate-binding protein
MPLRLLAMVAVLSFALASCGGDDEGSSGGGGGAAKEAGGTTPDEAKCGMASGEKATGDPIKVGAIVTKIPGIDFTDITDAAKAYFDCANDNGGINGRPVEYIVEEHGTDPQQVGSLAGRQRGAHGSGAGGASCPPCCSERDEGTHSCVPSSFDA